MTTNRIRNSKEGVSIELMYALITDGKRFLAVAPHLKIVGFGKTEKEAIKDFDKAVNTFLLFHEKFKNLHAKLLSLGWNTVDHKIQAPVNFNVPTDLLVNAHIKNTSSKAYAACY